MNHPVLVRDHTAKPFGARSNDYICVGFQGKNRVFVKDNHSTVTKVNRKDVTPVEMDIKIAELFNESRSNSKVRDAQLAMPTSKIPDLGWQFDEDVQLIEPVTEQIYSLDQLVEEEDMTSLTPTAPQMEEEAVQTEPEITPMEEVEIQAVQLVNSPEKPATVKEQQTPIAFKFLAVLQPVAAAVSKQITNKTHF